MSAALGHLIRFVRPESRLVILYLTLKLAMQGILKECNRLAQEQEALQRSRWLRQVLFELEQKYLGGEIDLETYLQRQDELLRTHGDAPEIF